MPNRFEVKLTNGAIALERHWEKDPDGLYLPPTGGGGGAHAGEAGPSTEGRIAGAWSERSRRHMRWEFSALPWEMLGTRPGMFTFTYPGEWQLWVPNSDVLVKHRESLKERWRKRYGSPIGVWVVEFQRRGAPHLHSYLAFPDAVSNDEYAAIQERTMRRKRAESDVGSFEARRRMKPLDGEFGTWLRTAWFEVVGSGLPAHHARGVDIAASYFSDAAESMANRAKVGDYFWRESGKWGQKEPPEGFVV